MDLPWRISEPNEPGGECFRGYRPFRIVLTVAEERAEATGPYASPGRLALSVPPGVALYLLVRGATSLSHPPTDSRVRQKRYSESRAWSHHDASEAGRPLGKLLARPADLDKAVFLEDIHYALSGVGACHRFWSVSWYRLQA